MSNATDICTLSTAPKILILFFDRDEGLKSNIKLEYNIELDISKYVRENQQSRKYKLIGLVAKEIETGNNIHFIAHCLSPVDNQYYTYNDENVNKIEDLQKEVIDSGMPYILFYKSIE